MTIYSIVKDRTQLDEQLEEYERNGGKVQQIKSSCIRYEKEQVIRRGLHYPIHYLQISKETGISLPLLKSIKRQPYAADASHIETLYQFFKSRDLTQC